MVYIIQNIKKAYYLFLFLVIISVCYLIYTYVIYPIINPFDTAQKVVGGVVGKVGEVVSKTTEEIAKNLIDGTGPTSSLTKVALDGSTSFKDYLENKAFGPEFQNALTGGGRILKEGDECTPDIYNFGQPKGIFQSGRCIWNGVCGTGTTKNNNECVSNDYGKECTLGGSPGMLQKYDKTRSCVDTGDCKPNFDKINNVCIYKDKCTICRESDGLIFKYNRYGKCPTTGFLFDADIDPDCPTEFAPPTKQEDCQQNFNFVNGKCIYKNKDNVCTTTDGYIGKYGEFGECIKNNDNQCATGYGLVNGKCISINVGNTCSLANNNTGIIVDYGNGPFCVEDKCITRPNEYEKVNNTCLYKNRNKPCEADFFGSKVPGTYSNDGDCFRNAGGIIGV
jgi:hypothetical protein